MQPGILIKVGQLVSEPVQWEVGKTVSRRYHVLKNYKSAGATKRQLKVKLILVVH